MAILFKEGSNTIAKLDGQLPSLWGNAGAMAVLGNKVVIDHSDNSNINGMQGDSIPF